MMQVRINKYIDNYETALTQKNLRVFDEDEIITSSIIYANINTKSPLNIVASNKGKV